MVGDLEKPIVNVVSQAKEELASIDKNLGRIKKKHIAGQMALTDEQTLHMDEFQSEA